MKTGRVIVDTEDRREYAQRVLARLKIDKPFYVEFGEHIEQRTVPQNSRLWLLHNAAAKHVGCSPADMHEDMLCEHFGFTEIKMPSGMIKRIPLKRSSARDKKEFKDFMEFVESFYISQLGVWLE